MILRGAVSALFLYAAFAKLRHPHQFAQFGYPDWFAYLIGMFELACAIGLWIRKYARHAAFGLVLVMVGAIGSYARIGELRQGVVPVIVLFALSRLAMAKR